MDLLKSTLLEYGLSDKEATIYLATLMLGSARANDISKKANLLRETSYAVLQALIEKGLMSSVLTSGVKEYRAASPKKLIELLDEKKRKMQTIVSDLESLQLTNIQKPVVEFYEGAEGLMTATNDMVRKGNFIVDAYVNTETLQTIPFYHPGFRLRRKEKNVFMNVIAEESTGTKKLKTLDNIELRKTKINHTIMHDLPVGFYIYGDKVLFIKANKKEQYGILIQDAAFAELQKRIYKELSKRIV